MQLALAPQKVTHSSTATHAELAWHAARTSAHTEPAAHCVHCAQSSLSSHADPLPPAPLLSLSESESRKSSQALARRPPTASKANAASERGRMAGTIHAALARARVRILLGPMPPALGKLLREPLLLFLIAGGLLFALERAVRPREPSPVALIAGAPANAAAVDRRIVVDQRIRDMLAEEWSGGHGRPPTPDELGALVDKWLDDEMLYREALVRGLDQDDVRVRERLRTKMALVFETQVSAPEPSAAELQAYFDQQPERYAKPELVDFVQVFVAGEGPDADVRAKEILARLRAGARADGLGDTFSGGRRYRRRKIPDLAEAFGAEFADALAKQQTGAWELLRSRHGQHLVQIEERSPARAVTLAEVQRDVRRDWQTERRGNALGAALAELRKQWVVVRE